MSETVTALTGRDAAGGLAGRALRGVLSGFAQAGVQRVVGFASQLALAALLQPADFGLIGLATGIGGIVQSLTDMGVEDVLVRRRNGLALWCAPAFWTTFGLLGVAGIAMAAIAPLAAIVYRAPSLTGLLLVLAVSMPLGALSTVPGVVLRSELRFGFLAAWGSGETIVQAALTVGFAASGLGAYSFVLPLPIVALARALGWHAMWRARTGGPTPSLLQRPRARVWRRLVGISGTTFATKVCLAVIAQGDYAMLGLVAGHAAVGCYWFGFRLAAQPLFIFAGNLSGVLFPTLVALAGDRARQGQAALKASAMLSTCVMPAAFGQAAIAAPLIERFFAHQWARSVPVIELLSIGLGFDAVSWIAGALLAARGEFRPLLNRLLVQTPLFLLLAAGGAALGGAVGTAVAVAAYYVTTQPLFVWSVFRKLGVTRRAVAALYLEPAALAAVAVGAGLAAAGLLPPAALLGRVAVTIVVAVALYAALVRWRQPAIWSDLLRRIRAVRG